MYLIYNQCNACFNNTSNPLLTIQLKYQSKSFVQLKLLMKIQLVKISNCIILFFLIQLMCFCVMSHAEKSLYNKITQREKTVNKIHKSPWLIFLMILIFLLLYKSYFFLSSFLFQVTELSSLKYSTIYFVSIFCKISNTATHH